MMKDISKNINKSGYELMWDELRYKVILFVNDDPVSFVTLGDNENTMEGAMAAASQLINSGGVKIASL